MDTLTGTVIQASEWDGPTGDLFTPTAYMTRAAIAEVLAHHMSETVQRIETVFANGLTAIERALPTTPAAAIEMLHTAIGYCDHCRYCQD